MKTMHVPALLYALAGLAAVALPWLGVYPVFLMKLLCFAMFACAYNLLLGYGRMLSFGHAAFFGFAAYVSSWLITAHGAGPGGALLSGMAVAAALGAVIGGLAIRRRGIYFAMITLALGQLVYFVCLEAPFTGGENGLRGVPRGTLLGLLPLRSDRVMYYFVLGVFAVVFLFIRRVVHSPFGHVLRAIHENEARVISLGYDINRYRLLAFVLSAMLSGLAGSLNALVLGFATLSDVQQSTSGEVVLMTLLGGTGTFFGPVLGAAIVITLQEYLSDVVGGWVTAIIGVIFVACVLSFRRGIVGELEALRLRRGQRAAAGPAAPA
jgi:branched-chain amino acid transport system permease protein